MKLGRYGACSGVCSRPGTGIVVGSTGRAALKRTLTRAQGWYGFALDQDSTRDVPTRLSRLAAEYPRPAELGPLEISPTPRHRLDRKSLDAYTEMGVHRPIPMIPRDGEAKLPGFVEDPAKSCLG